VSNGSEIEKASNLELETKVLIMKKVIFGLLTVSFLGMIVSPVKADEANVQNSSQTITQDGYGNTAVQSTEQEIRSNSVRDDWYGGPSDSTGNVQDVVQDSFQRGVGNVSGQATQQRVEVRKERKDRGGYYRW
jgi:hypothetical protein